MTGHGLVVLALAALAAGTVLLVPVSRRSVSGVPGMSPAGYPRSVPGLLRAGWRAVRARVGTGHDGEELQVLDGLAAALEAGLPVPRALALALDRAGDGDGPWAELTRAAELGQALGPAWERTARRSRSRTLASVARAWRVASLTGAPLAGAIRVAAHTARERRRLERAVEVATAGARATVTVLTLLPVAGVGLAAGLGVPPGTLYGHPVAQASAGAGALLVLLGQIWSRRMVARVLHGVGR